MGPDTARSRRVGLGLGAAIVALVVVLAAFAGWSYLASPSARTAPPSLRFQLLDETAAFGPILHPGVLLGAAGNQSAVLAGGIGVYDKPSGFTLPLAASLTPSAGGAVAANLTAAVNDVFWEGGLYGLVWNGTAWMIGGQAAWGGVEYDFGSAVALEGNRLTNVTPWIGPYFVGGGVFAVGWNGTAWLFGGNSSAGVVLVALDGTHVTNLSGDLRWYIRDGWIQTIHWNGDEWLLGGNGIFGTLRGSVFRDLLPGSPFDGNGVWAADWNGSAWLAGGGAGQVELVESDIARPGPTMPRAFDQAVLVVDSVAGGWVVGGKGSTASGGFAPELVFLTTAAGPPRLQDLGGLIPGSFLGGEVQGGAPAPAFGAASVVLVGEGAYNEATGYGVGATAILTIATGR